jgi:5-methyltetrahydrofolate--homocysteine methyltransferase
MSAPDEIRAAARAAGALAMPYAVTASFDTAGKTMMGMAPADFAALTAAFDPRSLAFGANCGVGASDLVMSVLAMTQARPEAVVIAKANAGIPHWHGAHVHYSGTPELMADYAGLAIDAGARIVGGCCGSTAAHVAAMRRAIDRHAAGARPQLAEIVAALGPLVAPASTVPGRTRLRRRGSAAP